MCRHLLFGLLVVSAVVALAGVARAKNVTVTIPMENVKVKSNERGDCYVVKFEPPADIAGKRLDSVFLDFVVDASPRSEDEAEATPLVAVFPLTEVATGPSLKYDSDLPSVTPVAMGQDRKVRADITDIVRGWLTSPPTNHGLVIGALAGPDVGRVELRNNALSAGTALRVTFFYQNRFGNRVSKKQ